MTRLLPILLFTVAFALKAEAHNPMQVMFYNVENLFDPTNDPSHDDDEFTPDGLRRWHHKRYREKLTRLSKVIIAAGGEQIPALVGLAEVENDSALFHLTRRSPLRSLGYHYIEGTTGDRRGIRTALLYQPDRVKPFSVVNHSIDLSFDKEARPTRTLLAVSLRTSHGDTLHVVVCHFPSRSGGIRQTDPYRMAAARTLRAAVDSLLNQQHSARIVVMGDFNDNPTDQSLKTGLGIIPADTVTPANNTLYSLTPVCSHPQVEGSYKFRGTWYGFDQIFVSGALMRGGQTLSAHPAQMEIVAPSFLLLPETAYFGLRPFATYYGMKYQGGFSDHLPVIVRLQRAR